MAKATSERWPGPLQGSLDRSPEFGGASISVVSVFCLTSICRRSHSHIVAGLMCIVKSVGCEA